MFYERNLPFETPSCPLCEAGVPTMTSATICDDESKPTGQKVWMSTKLVQKLIEDVQNDI